MANKYKELNELADAEENMKRSSPIRYYMGNYQGLRMEELRYVDPVLADAIETAGREDKIDVELTTPINVVNVAVDRGDVEKAKEYFWIAVLKVMDALESIKPRSKSAAKSYKDGRSEYSTLIKLTEKFEVNLNMITKDGKSEDLSGFRMIGNILKHYAKLDRDGKLGEAYIGAVDDSSRVRSYKR